MFLTIGIDAIETILINLNFFRLVSEFKNDVITSTMLFLTTFKTIYFRKINEIIILNFFCFIAQKFVFTTSIFAIFTISASIIITASIDRTLHTVIILDIEELFIKKIIFFQFFQNQIFEICHSFRKEFSCVRIVESTFLTFFFSKKLRNDF